MEFKHFSVMLDEAIENLSIKENGIYVDGTVGGGGHSLNIAKHLSKSGKLIMFDQDIEAISAAKKRLSSYKDNTIFIHSNYEYMKEKLNELSIEKVDGILLDLGVSSYQIDNTVRGFSYMNEDEILDMRMDKDNKKTAADILNQSTEEELYQIIHDFGEEKFAYRIAQNIVNRRSEKEFKYVKDLNDVIYASIPYKARKKGSNPCKKTYQALRISLNRELEVLNDSLNDMIDMLNNKGRICVITFHSLEDRIVKNIFKKNENPCICPPEFPVCVCKKETKGKVITRKAIVPSEKELSENTRSRSAKLRVFEKIDL